MLITLRDPINIFSLIDTGSCGTLVPVKEGNNRTEKVKNMDKFNNRWH